MQLYPKLATQITNYNIEDKNLEGEASITRQHIRSSTTIRDALKKEGIKPEDLPPGEDTKKIERRLNSEKKKLPKTAKKLKKKDKK